MVSHKVVKKILSYQVSFTKKCSETCYHATLMATAYKLVFNNGKNQPKHSRLPANDIMSLMALVYAPALSAVLS